jgi:hypothetical protein
MRSKLSLSPVPPVDETSEKEENEAGLEPLAVHHLVYL